ncbi:FUSC family protein [Ancylobacter sp. 6x-1]|uniref:FUSC family protein n=1 Tax=Ancylobacter crimeensis TaxID=2579147 RepID=A0ABT0D786_9HYPH|nr:FUSC family protein [Ancylobacter crimeensis]MCK0195822.1 FUSC family protein [Ancylobacter crimeensis]
MSLDSVNPQRPLWWLRLLPDSITWAALGFALRTTAASLVALYIAFRLDLEDPKWAAMTVWVVAQNSRGMSLAKSRYRILGTLVGAVVAVTLIALFAQSPGLFIPAMAGWLGLCTAVSTGLRNFRSYGAVLAGYTAAIIAFDAVARPQDVFDIAVARVIYIGLGILTESVFTTVLAPGSPLAEVQARLDAYLRRTAEICARAVQDEVNTAAFQRLFANALDLDVAAEYAAAASATVRRRFGHLRGASIAAMTQLAAAQSLRMQRVSHATDHAEPLAGETADLLAAASRTLDVAPAALSLRGRVEEALALEAACEPHSRQRLFVLDRLAGLLGGLHEGIVRYRLFGDENAPASRLSFSFHVDHLAALHNGIRAFVGVALGSLFWIVTAWSSGPTFVVILSVICALYATRPDPVGGGMGFLKGGCAAVCAAALCNFAILPHMTTFAELASVIAVFMVGTGLAMRHPGTAAPATSFAFLFLDLIGPDNSSRPDPAAFFNGAVALLMGVGFGIVVFMVLFPADPAAQRARLRAAARRDLARIGRNPARFTTEHWLSRMADRLRLQAAADRGLPEEEVEANLRDMIAALTIGQAVLALAGLARQVPTLRDAMDPVLRRLGARDGPGMAEAARRAADRLGAALIDPSLHDPGSIARPALIRGIVLLQDMSDAVSARPRSLAP